MKIIDFLKENKNIDLNSKNQIALSNDVFEYNDYFYKKYSVNSFKDVFNNQDIKIQRLLKNTTLENEFIEFEDGIASKKINGVFLKTEDLTNSIINQLINKIIEFNRIKSDLLLTSGFFRAFDFFKNLKYVNVIVENEQKYILEAKKRAYEDMVLTHNDLISDNILFIKNEKKEVIDIKFIDFEYGGLLNYHFDIACLLNSWQFSEEKQDFILKEFEKYYKIDHQYLKHVRLTLYIFWCKLCDFKYNETKDKRYPEIRKYIKMALDSDLQKFNL